MKITLFILLLIPSVAVSQEHARILEHETVYEIIDANSVVQTEKYKIRINSEEGYGHAYFVDYTDKFRKIDEASIEIFSVAGERIKKIRKNQGTTMSFNSSYEISDARMFMMDPDYKNFPFTVEITKRIVLNGFLSLEPWVPRSAFNLAVDRAVLKVIYPSTASIAFKEKHISGKTVAQEGKSIRMFEVSGLAAVDKKIRYKDFYEMQPRVFVKPEAFELDGFAGSNKSWKEFGDWFYKLNDTPFKLNEKTKAYITSLDKSDKRGTIEKLYKYMQDKTRYVSIQLGVGGFKSLPTEDVEAYGYGDCKALSTYMKNMLTFAGIKSNYILVSAGSDQPDIQSDFPVHQFNHVFLAVPLDRDTIHLECTTQTGPADYVGKFTDDRHVLWIEKNNSIIVRSKVYDAKMNQRNNVVEMTIDKEGNSVVKFKTTSGGVFFDDVQLYKLGREDIVKQANIAKFSYPDFSIKNFKYQQDVSSRPLLSEEFLIDIRGLARIIGDKMVMPLMPAIPAKEYIDKNELLKYYSIRRAFSVSDEIDVVLPENFWIYNLPPPEKISSAFGSYEYRLDADGGRIKISRKFTINKGDYTEGHQYEEFKKFFDSIEKLENKKIVLNTKT